MLKERAVAGGLPALSFGEGVPTAVCFIQMPYKLMTINHQLL